MHVDVTWRGWATDELGHIRAAGQWRAARAFDARGPAGTLEEDDQQRAVVSFASNDYLGLSSHRAVVAAAHEALDRWGAGAGAARLVVGSRPVHHALERELAEWKRTEAAVVFSTGFAANLGVLTTLGRPGGRVVSDELNHASIIDGCRLSRADVAVYRHGDADHCAWLLAQSTAPAIVVSDSVFSMDGDVAPIPELADACRRAGALLVLDVAHGVLSARVEAPDCEHVIVGTLSKTLGSLGGFVAGTRVFTDLIVNRARPFIFTTALTPADTAAALAAVRIVRSDEGRALTERLRAAVDRLVPDHPSPIVPILIGDENDAVDAADRLLDRGVLVPAIRPPTVAPGTSRLRVALSAAHTDVQLDALTTALDHCHEGWRAALPPAPVRASR